MRTVGQLLRDERLKRGLEHAVIEKQTKIRSKFLKALEEDNYKDLPSSTYAQGFLKNYSEYLGLNSSTMVAMFRRQYTKKDRSSKQMIEQPLINSPWQITPNKVILLVIVLFLLGLFGFFYREFQLLHVPPPLTLESPEEGLILETDEVPVFGITDTDATLTINKEPVLVQNDGKFYKDIPLQIGETTIIVEAQSRVGEKTSIIRKVTRVKN